MAELVSLRRKDRPYSVLEVDDITDGSALSLELAESVEGEVRFGAGDRALYATDSSNYRQVPIGVVVPKHADDVARAMEVCHRFEAPVLSRGGGTSLAGQCCNRAVVLDFSKYMREVIELDPDRRLARVQPGTVLDDLNRIAAEHGLTFGPDPSTHDHCTMGGMIGNNSCGTHSVQSEFYGPGVRTEDHVKELEILTYDGLRMRVGPTGEDELEAIVRAGGRRGEIYVAMRHLRDRHADLIRARFPNIPRRVSGYNLPALLPENGFDVGRLLVGTEGTCVTILEATVELAPSFPERALLLLGYEDVAAAADDVERVRELRVKPIALEGMDDILAGYVRRKHLHASALDCLPEGRGWLLVEFGAATLAEAEAHARAAEATLGGARWPTTNVLTDPRAQKALWGVREAGLGATAFVPGLSDMWEGWEDSAVPPSRLGPYLRDLRGLFDRYGFEVAVYGHFGQGCIHCRIPFELTTREGIEAFRSFTFEAAELVSRFGGSLSGEHGDGQSRGELLSVMFGDELVDVFRELKRIWDPDWKMNPGKIVDAHPRTADLRLGADYHPWEPETRMAFTNDEGELSRAALRCVGVGKCRREGGGVMCPSYMVTREEKHSTRGRAHLLFELVRGEELDGWKSEAVEDALDLCLACKGCKSDCPVNVDMALYKSEFLYHHYKEKRRPRQAYAFGLIDRWARIGTMVPGLVNWASHAPLVGTLAKKIVGMSDERTVPPFANRSFRRWFEAREHRDLPPREHRVILWPDTFNNYFFPRTLAAAVDVLESAGVDVDIPAKTLCCGRPLYDYGMLDRAERYWRDILTTLRPEIVAGTTVVGIEPSCVAAFRDELLQMLPDDPLAKALSAQTKTLGEYLESIGWDPPALRDTKALHQGHCHHHAVMGLGPERRLLERMGIDLELPDAGCCGMAGAFGFERDHYDVSVACGERVLLPRVRAQGDDAIVIADGFSCREQISQLTDRGPLHVAEVMQLALHQRELAREPARPEEQLDALTAPELEPATISAGRVAFVLAGAVALGAAAWWLASRRDRSRRIHHGESAGSEALGHRGGLHPGREHGPRAGDDEPRDRVPAEHHG